MSDPKPVNVSREADPIERMLRRERVQREARATAPCPTCLAPVGARCVDTASGQATFGIHRERYREARLDESLDVYVLHDDPMRGLVRAGRCQAAIRECDLLIIAGEAEKRNRLLACIPSEFWNGREIIDPAIVR